MRTILNILLILLIVSTVSICYTKPDMHKTVLVYDSDYTIVPKEQTETITETIPIMEQPAKPKVETVKIEAVTVPQTKTVKSQPVKTTAVVNQTKKQTFQSKTTAPVKTTTTKEIKPVQATKPVQTVQKQTTVTQPVQAEKKQTVQVEQKPVVKQEQAPVTKKVLTQQEENIAWNTWRSNLQNKIMQDTRLPYIPNGVIFKFSFTVDEYGRISNLQTWRKEVFRA